MYGKKIAALRKEKKLSQEKLSKLLNVSRSTVAMWENDSNEPSTAMLIKIAEIFNVDITEILPMSKENNTKKGIKIPVLGNVAAGIPISAIEDIIDWEEISEELAATGEYFGLVIKGDSMEPRMTTGDIVIVKYGTAETGEIAIVQVENETATCKKIKKTPEGLMLISINPAYEPMFYSKKEVIDLPVSIIGKVVELRAKF